MKARWRLLLVLVLVALAVGGTLVARSPQARVRWLELRARSSDRDVRVEARWALLASRPEIDDDEFLALVAAELEDMDEGTLGGFLCTTAPVVSVVNGERVHDVYDTKFLRGAGGFPVTDKAWPTPLDANVREQPQLVLGQLRYLVGGGVGPIVAHSVPLDAALAARIEKLAAR